MFSCIVSPPPLSFAVVVAHILALLVFQAALFVFWPEQLSLGWSNNNNKGNNNNNNTRCHLAGKLHCNTLLLPLSVSLCVCFSFSLQLCVCVCFLYLCLGLVVLCASTLRRRLNFSGSGLKAFSAFFTHLPCILYSSRTLSLSHSISVDSLTCSLSLIHSHTHTHTFVLSLRCLRYSPACTKNIH